MTRTLTVAALIAAGFLSACSPSTEPTPSASLSTTSAEDLAALFVPTPQAPSPIEQACAELKDFEHMMCMIVGGNPVAVP